MTKSFENRKIKTIAVVCRDAGGANILANYIKKFDANFKFVLSGPAIQIFKNFFPDISIYDHKTAINNSEKVICSSGFSEWEKKGLYLARELKKFSIVSLDHWSNYKQRFVFKNRLILPHEIWVYDKTAKKLIKKIFPEVLVKLKTNTYLINQINEIKFKSTRLNIKDDNDKQILYLLQPIDKGKEFLYLDLFIKRYYSKYKNNFNKILIKPHPSEHKKKYLNWVKKNFSLPIKLDNKITLIDAIVSSDLIVGIDTYAMYVAKMAGKSVYQFLPSKSIPKMEVFINMKKF